MSQEVKNKWHINRQMNDYARKLKTYTVSVQDEASVEQQLDYPCLVLAYSNGRLFVKDPAVWELPSRIWALIDRLQDWLKTHHPTYYKELQRLQNLDDKATRKARTAKILGAIGNNLDDLPELEDEIIKIGRMLEKGESIKNYCRYYNQ